VKSGLAKRCTLLPSLFVAAALTLVPVPGVQKLPFPSSLCAIAEASTPVTIGATPTVSSGAVLLPNSVTSANIAIPFSQTVPTSGGVAPLTWSLSSGSLPQGLTLNIQTGEISGTAAATGVFPFTLQVTDSVGVKDTKEWTLLFNEGLRSGWPRAFEQRVGTGVLPSSPLTVDLDGDGKDEIVTTDADTLYVFYPDGTYKKVVLPGALSSPAVADLDGDGKKEIIVSAGYYDTSTNSIYAFHADLTPVDGFPAGAYSTYNGGPGQVSSPVVADFKNDGQLEIAVLASPNNINDPNYGKSFIIMADSHGVMVPGWPQYAGHQYDGDSTPPAVADLYRDGSKELVVASTDGIIRVFGSDGKLLKQWQLQADPVFATANPIVADVDGDGFPDLVIQYSNDRNVVAVFDRNGGLLPGWPRTLPGDAHIPIGPVVADLDGDGRAEIIAVAGSWWNELHVLKGDGSYLPGWPVTINGGRPGSDCGPVVADLDGDGKQEIVMTGTDDLNHGKVVAYSADGTAFPGFPKYVSPVADLRSAAAIGDVDGNGNLDLVVKGEDGYLYLWEMPQRVAVKDLQWPTFRSDAQHSGTLLPPQPNVSPTGFNFQDLLAGTTSAAHSFTVTNPRPAAIAISAVSLSGLDRGMFAVSQGTCGSLPRTLAPQQSCTFNVSFAPSSAGDKAATLTVNSSTNGILPAQVLLTGRGTPPGYTLSYSKNGTGNGAITSSTGTTYGNSGSELVAAGTVVTLTPAPAIDSVFSGWAGCDSVSGNVCTVTINSDRGVAGTFNLRTFTVSTMVTSGTATAAPVSGQVNYGGSLTVTITPAANQYLTSFKDNGSDATLSPGSGNSYSYTLDNVTCDHALTVAFAPYLAVAAGASHTLALKQDGTVWAWGSNSYGQLGDGTTTAHTLAAQVPGLAGVVAVAANGLQSVALKGDGSVWAWGNNGNGQLGDGSTVTRTAPVKVSGLSGVTIIAAGNYHTMAIKSDGTLWGWGYNGSGQLGIGNAVDKHTPVQVPGISSVTAISAGYAHTVALLADGSLLAWGDNGYGALGDGTLISRSSPVKVQGVSGVAAIAAGLHHTSVVKPDGTTWGWGGNGSGQVGDGTTTQRLSPVQVPGLADAAAIFAGSNHSVVLKRDGTVWSWGDNSYGQLGDGSRTRRLTPVQVAELTGVVGIAAGGNSTLAMLGDNSLWGWGANDSGQLGDGTKVNRLTRNPVQGFGTAATPLAVIGNPADPTNSTGATLSVSGTGVVSYRYRLDGGNYVAETSVAAPIVLTSLAEGTHVIAVIGKDASGSWQRNPTTTSWTVDLTPPTAVVYGAPSGFSNNINATLTVGSTDIDTYRYKVDNGSYSAAVSWAYPINIYGLSEATHTVSVIGKDLAGNWQVTPSLVTWTVDVSAPSTVPSPMPGSFGTPQNVTLTCIDGAGSGCAGTYYCLGSNCTPTTLYSGPIPITASSILRFYSQDAVANRGSVTTTNYYLVVPAAPVATAASAISDSGFTANWSPSSLATGYRLDVALDQGFTNLVPGYGNLDVGNLTSYQVNTGPASPVGRYYYRTRSYNSAGTSPGSNLTTVDTLPSTPIALVPSATAETSFVAKWSLSNGARFYALDVATDSSFTNYVPGYRNLNVGNVTSYLVNSGITAGTTYYYRVRAQNGSGIFNGAGLDSAFYGSGIVVHNGAAGGNNADHGNAVILDASGKILVAGDSCKSTLSGSCLNTDMALWRYNADGTLDTTFNSPYGYLHSSGGLGSGTNRGYALRLDPLGEIEVAGDSTFINTYAYNGMTVWKYTTNGTLDTTFNAPSGYLVDKAVATSAGNSLGIDASGRILVAGFGWNGTRQDMAIWRYNLGGSTDTTFKAPAGYLLSNNVAGKKPGQNSGSAMTIDATGKILVTGYAPGATGGSDMAIWRYNADGSLDSSFNAPKGYVTYTGAAGRTNAIDSANAIAIDTSGKVLVTGSGINAAGNADMVIWRYNPDGSLDTTFNGTGIVVHGGAAGGNGDDYGRSIALDGNGRILVAGSSTNAAGHADMVVWRYNANGSPDTSLNGTGYVVSSNAAGGNGDSFGRSIAIDASGRIVVTGSSVNAAGNDDMVIWRYLPGWTSLSSNAVGVTTVPAAPTALSTGSVGAAGFNASWNASAGVTGYRLDLATDSSFTSLVPGYNSRDLGNVTGVSITGLSGATTYYCRVAAYNAGGTSGFSNSASVTLLPADYQVSVTVSGSGLVESTPSGISTSGSTSARFATGLPVTLHATPADYSVFVGWTGACSGTGDCLVAMTNDRTVIATFAEDTARSTYIPTGSGVYSPSIQAAYDASADGDVIRLWGIDFTEDVLCFVDKKISLGGGYNEGYVAQNGITVLHGSLMIRNGVVNVDRLVLR
jgi:uncharacterized delta-60 repeat protein